MPRMTELRRRFGAEIQYQRQKKGFLQRDLAACAGIAHQSMSNIETGKQGLSLDQFVAIADCLYMSPAELIPKSFRSVVGERKSP